MLARTDKYFVKRYEDETNLRVYIALDRSASMGYSSARRADEVSRSPATSPPRSATSS